MSETEVQGVVENVPSGATEGNNGTVDAAAGGQAEAQQQQRPGGWSILKTLVVRMFFIYLISSFFRRSPTPAPDADGKPAVTGTTGMNLFTKGLNFDLYVYLKESEQFSGYDSDLFWLEEDLVYGDWTSGLNGDGSFEKRSTLQISDNVINNGTLFMHAFIVKSGLSPNPSADNYDKVYTIHQFRQLNKYKKKIYHTTVNLLTGNKHKK